MDKIYILNVKGQIDRLNSCLTSLEKSGFSSEHIDICEAKSCAPYRTTRELCEDAAADGFKFFNNILKNDNYKEYYITYLALTWGYFRFMRHITETGETATLIHDDVVFNCSFQDLKNVWALLPFYDPIVPVFISCLLSHYYDPQILENNASCWLNGVPGADCIDWAIAYTPESAKFTLDYYSNVDVMPLGWFATHLRSTFKNLGLIINPKLENLNNIEKINKQIANMLSEKTLTNGALYAAVTPTSTIKSSIHKEDGTVFRSTLETQDETYHV